MTEAEARAYLGRVFAALFDPAVPAETVGEFFTPDYVQIADGKRLDHAGFVAHARALKGVLAGGSAVLEKVVASGDTVATLHRVEARKKSGETVRAQVHAFFEFANGRIRRTDELTHLIEGVAADRDLGSRT